MDQTLLINAVNVYNLREIDILSLTIAHNIMLTHGRIYIKRALHFSPGRDDEGELKMMGVRRIRKESITRNTWIGA